jgi:hypothetical protein
MENCQPWQFYEHFWAFGSMDGQQNCQPWQLYGHFWAQLSKTANLSSFMDTFGLSEICAPITANPGSSMDPFGPGRGKLPTLAVLWTLLGCRKILSVILLSPACFAPFIDKTCVCQNTLQKCAHCAGNC